MRNADDKLELDVEAALAKLQPRPAAIDRDHVLFEGGKAAALVGAAAPKPRTRWLWPTATIVSFAASLMMTVLYGMERNRPLPPERIVYRTVPAMQQGDQRPPSRNVPPPNIAVAVPAAKSVAESRLLRMRHPALMTDVDHLPAGGVERGATSGNPISIGKMRRSMGGYSAADARPRANWGSLFRLGAR